MSRLYTTASWRRGRIAFLRAHPLCVMCKRDGRDVLARAVDHIQPHRGDQALFFDQANWQALCLSCHNSRKKRIEHVGYDAMPNVHGHFDDPNHPFNKLQGGDEPRGVSKNK